MRTTLLLTLLLTSAFSIAQIENSNFELIDKQACTIKSKSVPDLAKRLTEPYNTDLEKVRAIFIWVSRNIMYDFKGANDPISMYKGLLRPTISPIDSIVQKDYNDRIVEKVVKERQAICDGYARLFKSLCDFSNIKAVVVEGTIRYYYDPVGISIFRPHAWNAVSIDGKWYLLDPTWGNFYFLPDPAKFINDHFPDNSKWTLLKDPPTRQQFFDAIYIYQDYYNSNIISYQPKNGVIETATEGGKIKIELETDDIRKNLYIVEYPLDTIRYDPTDDASFLRELKKPHISKPIIEGKKIYLYHYFSCKARQILVYYNDRLVLCYGLRPPALMEFKIINK